MINNRYQLLEKLGQGGMGVVHRAYDRLTSEIIALKQVRILSTHLMSRLDSTTDRNLRVALTQEFQILASLRHPNIISVLDYGFDSEQNPFFTMTYLPDAQTILEAGAYLDVIGQVDLIRQTLQALAYLHRRGIIQRDVKPHNVLVSEGRVRVLDFGLSTHQEMGQVETAGSLLYMSPELLRREQPSEASDLYAVGVMAYELFAGHHPFDVNSGGFIKRIQHESPDLRLLGIDEALMKIIGSLLEKRVEDRYESARACLDDLNIAMGLLTEVESSSIRESFLQAATFVGCEAEMAQLQTALTEAENGYGNIWLVGGESGVGKSRLLDEFRSHALVSGWQVITGQAIAEGGFPFHLWRDVMPQLILGAELTDLEAGVLRGIVPSIEQLLNREVAQPPILVGAAMQQRLVHTIVEVLKKQSQPTLLLLEDLQWAVESMMPLKKMLQVIEQLTAVMVIGTYRDDERPELPTELSGSQHLSLNRLNEDQIAQLSRAMLGDSSYTSDIVPLLAQETEGNIFFIVEVMRAWAEDAGRLDKVAQKSVRTNILTSGMQKLLQRRISKIRQSDLELLHLAAVAGRQLDLQILQVTTPQENIQEWIQRVAETTIFTNRNNQWQFTHDKLREAILAKLDGEEHHPLHRQVAEAIEHIYSDDTNYYSILLEHWHQAGDIDKEIAYLPKVVRNLVEITANYSNALILLDRGFRLLNVDDVRRISLLNWQAMSYFRQDNYELASELSQQAQEMARKTRNQAEEATSLYLLGEVATNQSNYEQARDYHQQSLAIRQSIGDEQGIGNSLYSLGQAAYYLGNYEQADDYYQQSLAIKQKTGDQLGIGTSYNKLGEVAMRQGNYEQARDYFQQGLSVRQMTGDQRGIAGSLNSLGLITFYLENYEQADNYYQQSMVIKKAIGDNRGVSNTLINLGILARQQGKYEQASSYYHQSIVIQEAIGYQFGISMNLTNLGALALHQGKYEQANSYYHQSLAIRQKIGYQLGIGRNFKNLGDIAYYRGNYEQARDYYQQSMTIQQAIENQLGIIQSLTGLGFVDLKLNTEQARISFTDALMIAQTIQVKDTVLEIVVGFAWLYHTVDQLFRAAKLIGLVKEHTASYSDIQRRLTVFLPLLESNLLPTELKMAFEQGKILDLDVVAQELLDEFIDKKEK